MLVLRASVVLLAFSAAWFVLRTIHWPLVGDASLMHYVAFLIDHGKVPYRDIGEINLPGAFVPDWLVIHTLGGTALAWRVYDLFLLTVVVLAMICITRPVAWLAGIWAGLVFALIHGRDGLAQVGQRDLTVATLLVCAVAALLRGTQRRGILAFWWFGLAVGAAATIKPVAIPFLLLAVPLLWEMRQRKQRAISSALAGIAGFLLPVGAALGYLVQHGALVALLHSEATLARYHAGLGRRSLGFLLQHSFSPILPLAAIWLLLLMLALRGSGNDKVVEAGLAIKRRILWLAAALGLVGYIVQGKGYPYHRYTFIEFLLLIVAIDLDRMLRRRDWLRCASAVVLTAASVAFGAVSAWMAGNYDWRSAEFQTTLRADLDRIAAHGGAAGLSGRVQCLDTVAGCVNVLYNMQLQQSSGLLYDEFLFHPAGAPAVDETRVSFLREMWVNPPAVFVVSAPLFPAVTNDYGKLDQWPEFALWLKENYILNVERMPVHPVRQGGPASVPAGYRIYVLRGFAPPD